MKSLFLVLLCSVATLVMASPTDITSVSKTMEQEKYLLEARQLFEKKQYKNAEKWLLKARYLPLSLPADYYFMAGAIAAGEKKTQKAISSLGVYLNMTGRQGRYYQQALNLISGIEGAAASGRLKGGKKSHSPIIEYFPTQVTDSFVEQMSASLPEKDQSRSIQTYLNSLLKVNAVYEKGIEKASPSLLFRIQAGRDGKLIVTRSEQRSGRALIGKRSLSVYGMSRQLKSDCSWQEQLCWVLFPEGQPNNERWLEISYAPQAVTELVNGMSLLIRKMQQ